MRPGWSKDDRSKCQSFTHTHKSNHYKCVGGLEMIQTWSLVLIWHCPWLHALIVSEPDAKKRVWKSPDKTSRDNKKKARLTTWQHLWSHVYLTPPILTDSDNAWSRLCDSSYSSSIFVFSSADVRQRPESLPNPPRKSVPEISVIHVGMLFHNVLKTVSEWTSSQDWGGAPGFVSGSVRSDTPLEKSSVPPKALKVVGLHLVRTEIWVLEVWPLLASDGWWYLVSLSRNLCMCHRRHLRLISDWTCKRRRESAVRNPHFTCLYSCVQARTL